MKNTISVYVSVDAGLEDVLQLMRACRYEDAELLLDRLLHPKYEALYLARKALAEDRSRK